MMNTAFRIVSTLSIIALTTISAASAETLADLTGKTDFHGIGFARAGTAALLLATHNGLLAVDKSGSVTRVSPEIDLMGFMPDPTNPLAYFSSGHPKEGGSSGFQKSSDGGASWKPVATGDAAQADFHSLAMSAINPKTVYSTGMNMGLQVSHDAGITWTMAGQSPDNLIALAASAVNPAGVYAATQDGLRFSPDSGATWQPAEFPGEVVSMVQTAPDGSIVAFVVGRGLMKANESKLTEWSNLSNGFGQSIPLHFAFDPADGKRMVLATQDTRVLESKDGGATWAAFGAPQ